MESDAKSVDDFVSPKSRHLMEEKKSRNNRSKTLRKVRQTFMKHINKLQNELEGKSAQLVREVGVTSVMRKELSDANELNTLLKEENRSYKARIVRLENELDKMRKDVEDGKKTNDLNKTIKSLRETMERQSKDDFETIQKLKADMNERVKRMEEEWAATLTMVEAKQSSQANTIRALEAALAAEREQHIATVQLCEKTSSAMKKMRRKSNSFSGSSDSNNSSSSSSSTSPTTKTTTTTINDEKLKLEKRVRSLKSALKRQKSKCINLVKERDLIKESLEMWRQDDADNIVRRLERHQEIQADEEFENDKSFSDALKRLTVEARKQRVELSKATRDIETSKRYESPSVSFPRHVRRHSDRSSLSAKKKSSRSGSSSSSSGSRKRKTKKRVFYFNDKDLNEAFF